MIGYYVHHSGSGHLARAASICAQLTSPVAALTSSTVTAPHPFHTVIALPRDDAAPSVTDETAGGALHWAPRNDDGLRARMGAIVEWVVAERPSVVVVDVSVEVAVQIRLLGVPVIVVAMPGRRTDAPHELAYRLADHILACWPSDLYDPAWLQPHRHKVSYVGGVSRFDGRDRAVSSCGAPRVVVLGAAAGFDVDAGVLQDCAAEVPSHQWQAVGVSPDTWVADPWPQLCTADVVVAHAGESSVADLAAAARPAVLIPKPRPFDEQHTTAKVLEANGLALRQERWPAASDWPDLLRRASLIDVTRWRRWQTRGAARRAATAIERVAAGRSGMRAAS